MAKTKTPAQKKKASSKKEDKPAIERLDPRKAVFLAAYSDPKSPTYANAYASAKKAGYSDSYAKTITTQMPERVSEILGNERRVLKALQHVDEVLDVPIETQAMGAFGPLYEKRETFITKTLRNGKTKRVKHVEKIPIMTISTSRMKEKTKVAELALQALKREQWGKTTNDTKNTFIFNMAPIREHYSAGPVHADSKPAP